MKTIETENNPLEIWLVRHGETIFNIKGLVQGWSDSPLTNNGQLQTAHLGKKLKSRHLNFSSIYSSDLIRCLDTAEILRNNINPHIEIHSDKRLREINTGDGEGDSIKTHLKQYPYSLNIKKHPGTPNGENWNDVFNRVIPAIKDIGECNLNNEKVLVVSHSMVIAGLICYLQNNDELISIPNNSVTILEYKNHNIYLKSNPLIYS